LVIVKSTVGGCPHLCTSAIKQTSLLRRHKDSTSLIAFMKMNFRLWLVDPGISDLTEEEQSYSYSAGSSSVDPIYEIYVQFVIFSENRLIFHCIVYSFGCLFSLRNMKRNATWMRRLFYEPWYCQWLILTFWLVSCSL
jgi:hypothetical protein